VERTTSPAGLPERFAAVRGWVYVLCLDPPRGLGEADVPRDAVISHYVGWTQQDWPMKRAGGHAGAGMGTCVLLVPGTLPDEEELKTHGTCPRCGRSLDYRAAHV
jgi:hypothetical protein